MQGKGFRLHCKLFFLVGCAGIVSCSYLRPGEESRAHSRIFLTDYSTAWKAANEAVTGKGTVLNTNRDLGTIEVSWRVNTEDHNFLEAFGGEKRYRRSRYRLFIRLHEGKKNAKQAVIVRIQKEQQVEKSLFANWEKVPSTGVDEATYLYRIGRLIALQEYEEKIDEEKSRNF